jgi:hypothetical protein
MLFFLTGYYLQDFLASSGRKLIKGSCNSKIKAVVELEVVKCGVKVARKSCFVDDQQSI